jgi:Tfp pilus assembly protein PilN
MLRTNLSTRPFYNDRGVRVALMIAALLVAGFTTFNVLQVMSLNASHREWSEREAAAERRAADFTQQAQAIRQSLNTAEMSAVQQAASEANLLIERRVFSWTDLFNQFERTLPAEVRITAVEPQVDREGRLLIAITVISRRIEELNEFMDQLEGSGRFRDVLNRQDTVLEDGLTRSTVQGYYVPPAGPAAAAPAASESNGTMENATPPAPVAPSTPAEGAR